MNRLFVKMLSCPKYDNFPQLSGLSVTGHTNLWHYMSVFMLKIFYRTFWQNLLLTKSQRIICFLPLHPHIASIQPFLYRELLPEIITILQLLPAFLFLQVPLTHCGKWVSCITSRVAVYLGFVLHMVITFCLAFQYPTPIVVSCFQTYH